jgi:hypothetical protein
MGWLADNSSDHTLSGAGALVLPADVIACELVLIAIGLQPMALVRLRWASAFVPANVGFPQDRATTEGRLESVATDSERPLSDIQALELDARKPSFGAR